MLISILMHMLPTPPRTHRRHIPTHPVHLLRLHLGLGSPPPTAKHNLPPASRPQSMLLRVLPTRWLLLPRSTAPAASAAASRRVCLLAR